MTAFIDPTGTPQYQRAIQKLNRMTPDQQAIFSSFLVDTNEGEAAIKRQILAMRLAGGRARRTGSLALREKGFTARQDISEKRLATGKEIDLARITSNEDIYRANLESRAGIEDRALDVRKGAYPWQVGLGIANVATQLGTGIADYGRDIKMEELMRKRIQTLQGA